MFILLLNVFEAPPTHILVSYQPFVSVLSRGFSMYYFVNYDELHKINEFC